MPTGIIIQASAPSFPEGVKALNGLPSSVISDVMGRLIGSTGLHPVNRSVVATCGTAVTVRVRAGDNLLIHKALTLLRPGDVLVVDGEGDVSRALVGELMLTQARAQGAIAFVIDGAIRDVDAFETQQFPCWAKAVNLRGPYKDGPGAVNIPVSVGGMQVLPGDIIVGDGDGLVAIPQAEALEIAALARAKIQQEQATIAQIQSGQYSSAWVDELLKKF